MLPLNVATLGLILLVASVVAMATRRAGVPYIRSDWLRPGSRWRSSPSASIGR